MQGLSFPNYAFAELLTPILPDLDLLYWSTSFQQSPFPWDWREANSDWLEAKHLEVNLDDSDTVTLWRPGSLSTLAPILQFDEWSQLTGFFAVETELAQIAGEFRCFNSAQACDWSQLEKAQGILIVWVDGWWEVYTSHQSWLNKLSECHQGREIISENFGGNPPIGVSA